MRLLAQPTFMKAGKVTTCPVDRKIITPGMRIGNPGWAYGWCHEVCTCRVYKDPRPSYNSRYGAMVEVDDMFIFSILSAGIPTPSENTEDYQTGNGRSEMEDEMRFDFNPHQPLPDVMTSIKKAVTEILREATNLHNLSQPAAMGLLCNDAYHRTSTKDNARQQFLDAYKGRLNGSIRNAMRRREEEQLFR